MYDRFSGSWRRTGLVPTLGALVLGLAAGTLAGCGAGGADTSAAAQAVGSPVGLAPLAIATSTLPAGQPGLAYTATTLTVAATTSPVTWSVIDGALPAGLVLSPQGTLSGTPLQAGVSAFTACASDGTRSATRTLAVSVASFGLVALEGLSEGSTSLDTAVALACVGAVGDVRFEVVANGSGGTLGLVDAQTGRAVWRTGSYAGTRDVVRAIDLATGARAEAAFDVFRDPTAGFVAEFGSTDVWYVDTTRKHGAHPYATDFQAALVAAGLRQAGSTTREGARADRLAETCTRLSLLQHLSRYFLRGADGSRGEGLPVSFPWSEPVGYLRPSDASWIAGGAGRYSLISIVDGSQPGILGTAFTDGAQNGNHENDTSGPDVGELGVFANRFVETVNRAYNNLSLVQAPLTDEDAPVLEDLLHGRRTTHVRAPLLRNGIEALGRSIASVVAHEIGHSLGLPHTATYVPGGLMNSSAVFSPDLDLYFTATEVQRLRGALPGPGRAYGAAAKPSGPLAALTLPEGGVTVCEGTVCNLRLAPEPPAHSEACACTKHRASR